MLVCHSEDASEGCFSVGDICDFYSPKAQPTVSPATERAGAGIFNCSFTKLQDNLRQRTLKVMMMVNQKSDGCNDMTQNDLRETAAPTLLTLIVRRIQSAGDKSKTHV
jgi:hypothetical protein